MSNFMPNSSIGVPYYWHTSSNVVAEFSCWLRTSRTRTHYTHKQFLHSTYVEYCLTALPDSNHTDCLTVYIFGLFSDSRHYIRGKVFAV